MISCFVSLLKLLLFLYQPIRRPKSLRLPLADLQCSASFGELRETGNAGNQIQEKEADANASRLVRHAYTDRRLDGSCRWWKIGRCDQVFHDSICQTGATTI
uniref:Secreted protein n=1 Tax=Caenorhabditis tropicalis TaxID=1561998 RepID=A0A1I7TYY0_9PELO